MAFKDELRSLRLQDGLSQAELAKRLKISRSAVSMYESGLREPDFETLERIADFFNVNMDRLLPKKDAPAGADASGRGMVNLYFALNEEDRAMVDSMILRLSSKEGK